MGYNCSLVNARFVKPIDTEIIKELSKEHRLLVTMEENVKYGGFGEHVLDYLNEIGSEASLLNISLPDDYIEHGNVEVLKEETGISASIILKKVMAAALGQNPER